MLAYYDSFSGMVPVRIVNAFSFAPTKNSNFEVIVTAARGTYKVGERLFPTIRRVVPRTAVRFRKYGTRILPYSWADEYKRG